MLTPRTNPRLDWAANRAWSRAGAMADVLARSRARRAVKYGARVALHLLGTLLIATGVGAMLWNDIGVGPLDVFIVAIQDLTGLPLALSLYSVVASLLVIAWVLGRRPGPGNLITPLLMGPLLQLSVFVFGAVPRPDNLLINLPVHVIAIGIIAVGAGATITADIGAGTAELLSSAASDHTGHPVPRIRMVLEVAWLSVGALLGGPFGIGTLVVAFFIGPAVASGYRFVSRLLTTTTAKTNARIETARYQLTSVR